MGEDIYDSFIHYQRRLIEELDGLAREYGFQTIDASRDIDANADDLAHRVGAVLASSGQDRAVLPADR
jgi:hypothetical protein